LEDIYWLDAAPTYEFIRQSWWQYIVKINDGRARTTLLKKLLDEYKIPTANAYWPLCHQQSIYKDYLSPHGYKNSEELIMKHFSLPMYYELAISQVWEICEALREM
jgi:dTDP-4-amino-4,6-dideoxygalactose transaminase